MSIKLIAIHSIQTTDKVGNRVDVAPGKEFTVLSAKEAGDLIAAGAARKPAETAETAATETAAAETAATEAAATEAAEAASGNKTQGNGGNRR